MSVNDTPTHVASALGRARPGIIAITVAAAVGFATMGAVLARIVDPAPRSSAPAVTLPAHDRDCSMAEFECAWDPAYEHAPAPSTPLS